MVHAICLTAIKWLSKVIRIMAAFVYYYWAQLDDCGASVHLFGPCGVCLVYACVHIYNIRELSAPYNLDWILL